MFPINYIEADIRGRLAALRRRMRTIELLEGGLTVLLLLLGVAMFALFLELAYRFDVPVRTIMFWGSITCLCGTLAWYLGRPLLKLAGRLRAETDAELAVAVGKSFPKIHDRLLSGVELMEERKRDFYSPVLIDAALQNLHADLATVDFGTLVTNATSRRLAQILLGAGVLVAFLFFFFPEPFYGSAHRLWHYSEAFASPQPFSFVIEPGSKEIVKGESVRVTVRVLGEQQQQIVIGSRREGEEVEERRTLDRRSDGTFQHEFVALKATTRYTISSGTIQSETFTLSVVDRPVAKVLRVNLQFPTYAGLAAKQLDDNVGDIVALKGTRASFSIETNKDLRSAELVFSDSSSLPLHVRGSRATGDLTLMKDRSYQISLHDDQGTTNGDPIQYSIRILPDAYPTAAILIPGTNLDVTDKTNLPMLFKISDDFGFSRLRLAYRLTQSRYGTPSDHPTFVDITLPRGHDIESLVPYTWSLDGLTLVPDDVVQYYIEVFDNDHVSGPKSATSETYTLRYPSVDEVFAQADREQDRALEMMRDAVKMAEETKHSLDELRQDLKKEQEKADWQDRKKAEELAKNYEELQKNMSEVAKTVDTLMSRLQNNRLLSPETLAKYQELQQLMQEMNSPELAEALKRLQQAMQQMNLEQMKQALNQFSLSEENFRKSIERTMNLLRRIQIEQKIDELVKRADTMAQKQEQLRKETEANAQDRKERLPELADQQRDIRKDAGDLKRELAELQKKMQDFAGEMPMKETEQAQKELEQSNLEEELQQIADQLQALKAEDAMQGQRQAQQKMNRFSEQMQGAKKALQQNQQRQIVNEMRRVLQDLLEISRREEDLKKETRSLEQNSARFHNQAQGQMETLRDLTTVLDRLNGLANKTFSVSPEMGKSLGDAMRQMGDAMQSLDQRNGTTAGAQQSAAMAALNEAAMQVESAVNGMMQSGGEGGMGMSGFLQRLRGMTSKQQQINQETEGLTPEQAAAAARLAAEQGAVRKSLEQLAREASNSGQLKKMLGDLQKAAEDMREVQTDLAQGEVNPETIRRQERILSRLLDSQRSTRERDFEEKRRAETGTNMARQSPGSLDLSTQEGKNRLRRDLLRALEEGYSREYEELIRKYFESLNQ
jgi:hypothetical protein